MRFRWMWLGGPWFWGLMHFNGGWQLDLGPICILALKRGKK